LIVDHGPAVSALAVVATSQRTDRADTVSCSSSPEHHGMPYAVVRSGVVERLIVFFLGDAREETSLAQYANVALHLAHTAGILGTSCPIVLLLSSP